MMPMVRDIQTNFTAGEFDPTLQGRSDTTFYYNAAAHAENVVVLPQGGVKARDGLKALGYQRGGFTVAASGGWTVTAPEGGTAANAVDNDESTFVTGTTALGTVNPYVLVHIDMGSTQTFSAIDVVDLANDLGSDMTFQLQGSTNNSTWLPIGNISYENGVTVSRRFATTPGQTLQGRRYYRLARVTGTPDLGAAVPTVAEVRFLTEAAVGADDPVKLLTFTSDRDTEYVATITAYNIDFWSASTGLWLSAAHNPYPTADVETVKSAHSRDTMIMFHEDHHPWRIVRLDDDEWDFRYLTFDSTTIHEWGDTTVSNGVNEKQVLNFGSMTAGDLIRFELNGEFTSEWSWSATAATNESSIDTALEGHSEITSVTVTNRAGDDYEVEWDGADAKTPFPILVVTIVSGSGSAIAQRSQRGRADYSTLWDTTHGNPRDGTFHQGRLWMVGFKGLPSSVAASRAGSFYDFRQDDDVVDSSPIFASADTDEQVEFYAVHSGRHLQFFSSAGEFYVPEQAITALNMALLQTSRIGTKPGLPVLDVEGATFFVNASGRAIHEFLFVDTEQSYQAGLVSLLASHLVNDPIALALRRRKSANDSDLVYVANTGSAPDGTATPMSMVTVLRAQQVTAFTRMTSPLAHFPAVTATQGGKVFFIARRYAASDGSVSRVLETMDEKLHVDGGIRYENPDIDDFTGDGSTVAFVYTFSASTSADVTVWTRTNDESAWSLNSLGPDYSLNIGTSTVTMATAPASGTLLRIAKPFSSVTLETETDHLDGEALTLVIDGAWESGTTTPSSSVITLPSTAYHYVDYGLKFTVKVQTMPYLPEMPGGRPYGRKARIPNVAISYYRTGDGAIDVAMTGEATPRILDIAGEGTAEHDEDLGANVYSALDREWGLGGYHVEPSLTLTRLATLPWMIRAVVYDLIWG